MKLRQLNDYDDALSCIDSLWLRHALAEFTGKQITSKSWGIYRQKAGLISDVIGADGKVIPTKQRTVTAREAVMVMGACCWDKTIRRALNLTDSLTGMDSALLAKYVDRWFVRIAADPTLVNQYGCIPMIESIESAFSEVTREYTADDAEAYAIRLGSRSGEVPSKRTVKRWIDTARGRACKETISGEVMAMISQFAINYSQRFN